MSPKGDKFAVLAAAIEELLADGLGGGVESPDSQAHQVVQVEAAPLLHLLPQRRREHAAPYQSITPGDQSINLTEQFLL